MLTDVAIRKATPGPKPRKIMDGRGLYLLVTPAEQRWWRFKYRFLDKEKLLSLGVYPEVSLKAARSKAEAARTLVAAGTDPSAARQAAQREEREAASNDFESVARAWLENIRAEWSAVHHADSLKRFEVYVFPKIGHRPIRDITAPDLLEPRARNRNRRGFPEALKSDSRCWLGRRPASMGKSYSMDLRERVQAQIAGGQSRQGRPPGGGKLAAHLAALLAWVEAEPDMTMPELAAKLKAERDVTAHPASLSRVLLKAGLTFKKNAAGVGSRTRGRAPGA
jgi:hypothetical protein